MVQLSQRDLAPDDDLAVAEAVQASCRYLQYVLMPMVSDARQLGMSKREAWLNRLIVDLGTLSSAVGDEFRVG